jgi:hypothetical protein
MITDFLLLFGAGMVLIFLLLGLDFLLHGR